MRTQSHALIHNGYLEMKYEGITRLFPVDDDWATVWYTRIHIFGFLYPNSPLDFGMFVVLVGVYYDIQMHGQSHLIKKSLHAMYILFISNLAFVAKQWVKPITINIKNWSSTWMSVNFILPLYKVKTHHACTPNKTWILFHLIVIIITCFP